MEGIESTATQQLRSTLRCAKCSEDLSSCLPPLGFLRISLQSQNPLKLLVYLICMHIVHYNYINNPRKLCPICPSANVTKTDDMETDDDEIVINNFEIQGSSTTQNKRIMNPSFTEKLSNKKQKTLTNDGESPTLKRLIKELKTPSFASTDTQSLIANLRNLIELYDVIITAEDQNRTTNQEIIKKYYSFREELENIFNRFKSSYRDRKAQRMLIKEVTK